MDLLAKLVGAAAAIWAEGTAHRDLSPGNIMITPGGDPVIVDLGMARHVDDSTLTVLPTPGTPGWTSPEQVGTIPVHGDWRSDEFVLGSIGYCLLTGVQPFWAATPGERWVAPATVTPQPVRSIDPTIPAGVADVVHNQLGAKQGQYGGAIMVDGGFYCPNMPEDLIEATARYRRHEITGAEYRDFIRRRLLYKMRAKEKPDAKGRMPMMCPARGPGATAYCPVANACGGVKLSDKPDDELVPIYGDAAVDEKTGGILPVCANKSSVSFPIEAGIKSFQTPHYGSAEWANTYHADRGTIEGKNAFLKDGSKESLGDPTRRRLRGYTGQYFLIGMIYAASNLRALESFRDEYLDHGSDEALEAYFEQKLNTKLIRRKNGPVRIAPWNNFREREAETGGSPPDKP